MEIDKANIPSDDQLIPTLLHPPSESKTLTDGLDPPLIDNIAEILGDILFSSVKEVFIAATGELYAAEKLWESLLL